MCAGPAGCDLAHVVAAQRGRAADRDRSDRLVDGHVHVAHGQRHAERQRTRVAGPGIAVRGDGHPDAGVYGPPGVGVGLAGREVGGRQERGHGVAGGQGLDVVVGQVGAVVHRGAAHLHPELHTRPVSELVGVEPQAQAGVPAGGEHGPGLVGVEGARFAEHVDPADVTAHRVEHRPAHQLDVVVGAPLVLAGHQVGAQERGLRGGFGGQRGQRGLGVHRQPVTGLDLHRGGAGPVHLGQAPVERGLQRNPAGGPGGVGRDPDAAPVRRAPRPFAG